MDVSDQDLLQSYVQHRSETAFTELVRRHINVVYAAALRQVRSTALADEVTQSVFADLARKAPNLATDRPVLAWLHVVTRRTAIDAIRREKRRQRREQAAMETSSDSTPSVWHALEPLLDEALTTLDERDRGAILLRFFENKSLREVGAALHLSDDAAQKRVSRALERLRVFFERRGIVVGVAALGDDLSAHGTASAPATLLPSIASSAVDIAAATTSRALLAVTMKAGAGAVCALALGFALYEAGALWQAKSQLRAKRELSSTQLATARELIRQRDMAKRELARWRREDTDRTASVNGSNLEDDLRAWVARVEVLKHFIAEHPEQAIPELQLLHERDWLLVTWNVGSIGDLPLLRAKGRERLYDRFKVAFSSSFYRRKRVENPTTAVPNDIVSLAPLFSPPLDPSIWARYDVRSNGDRWEFVERMSANLPTDAYLTITWGKTGTLGGDRFEKLDDRARRETKPVPTNAVQ